MNEPTCCVATPKDTISSKIPRIYEILGDIRAMSMNICGRVTYTPGENAHDKTDENLEGVLDSIYNTLIDVRDYLRPVAETLN